MIGKKPASTGPTKLNQVNVQSSSLGVTMTVGWGRGRSNVNMIWYGGFQAIAHTTKQSGGKGLGGSSSTTDYTYTASVILALGEGPIAGINTVYRDKSTFTGASALADAGLSLATGTAGQSPWGYLTTYFPTQALGYSGIAYVYAQDYDLGSNATLSNHSFEVDYTIQLGGGVHDADPKDIVTDFLTNANYGLPGWASGLIGDLSYWSGYCRSHNLLLSPVLDSQRQASDFLTELMTATNSEAVWSEGVLKVGTYGDTAATANGVSWTPDLTPRYDLTEDDFIPSDGKPVKLEIVDQSDAYNMVQVEYLDRANQYNTAIAPAQDLANIVQYGRRKQDPTTLHSICDATIAQASAQLLLQRTLYMREKYTFTLPWNFARLEPMIDTVTLTTTTDELQLNRKQVRIVQIDEDETGNLAITAIGMDIGVASAAQYNAHSGSGYVPNLDVAPGSVSAPVLINAPTSLTGGAPEVWIAAASTNPNWGGCEVWVSADDVEYQRIGMINAPARIGVTTATLASHVDPDTTNTLAVDLTQSAGTLASATSTNADIGSTLCIVGTELVSYQTATLTSANHYNLTSLRRGLYGTTIAAHSVGEEFARIDDAVFRYAYGSLALGSTMYVKLPSYNVFGRAPEDIAGVTTYTLQISPDVTIGTGSLGGFTLINRANCFVDGRTVTKITGSNSWGDASVVSRESFIGGCFCGFQPVTTNADILIGLNSDPSTDDSYTSIDYGWFVDASGAAYAFESGSSVAGPFSYAAGDTFMVRYDGIKVAYLQNGTVRHTTTGVGGSLQLYLDSAFATLGGKVTNLTYAGTGIPGTDGTDGSNGVNAVTVTSSPNALTVSCDSTGAPKVGEFNKTAQLQVVVASVDETTSAAYSLTASGCSASVNSSGLVTFTGTSAEHAYADVTVTLGSYAPVVQRIPLDKVRDGASGSAGATTYIATLIFNTGTTPYVGAVVLDDGQTVTLHAEAVVTSAGGSPNMTLTAQYSTDGTSFSNMGGSYTDNVTIALHDTELLAVNGTYTNSSGAAQAVTFQCLLSNVGGTPSVGGGSFMQPTVS